MMKVRALLGVLLLGATAVVAVAPPAFAQGDEPLGGVVVTIEHAQDKTFVAKSITGVDGLVRFYVPSGIYRIITANAATALRQAAVKRGGGANDADKTTSITILVTTYGSVREKRLLVAKLVDGIEAVLIETTVASPIRVVIRRSED
jgi:hypothetical protein